MVEIPGFEIRRELGASSNASVYLALQTSLDREVALKVMTPALASDAAFGQRFLQEARTLASLAHPHIVPVYDVDVTAGGQHYFSMQYLSGGDFSARVASGITDVELTQTVQGIAEALDYVHQRGLVHRDVRPGNILYDSGGTPVLTDFGIARAVGASAGSTGTDFSAKTGHYMSPEQARGSVIDARADLYSLGALTYFGLTGKPPYGGPDGFAVAYAHVFEPIPRLPAERHQWQSLIDLALAKEPAQRFANAREFIDALAAVGTVQISNAAPARAAETAKLNVLPPGTEVRLAAPPVADGSATVVGPVPSTPAAKSSARSRNPANAPGATVQRSAPPDDANATVQRPSPTATALKPAHVSVLGSSAARGKDAPAEPAAKQARRSQLRWLPFAVAAAGIAVIGVAIYTQFLRHAAPPQASETVVTRAQPLGSPSAPAAPPASATAAPPDTTSTSSNAMTTATAPVLDAETRSSTDATAIPSLDAAAEAGVGEFVPVTDVSALPTVVDPVIEGVRLGRLGIAAQRLTQPVGNNALEFFQFVLKRDPKNKAAKQGIVEIARKYIELADKSQGSADMQAYLGYLTSAETVAKSIEEGVDLRKDIDSRRTKAAEPYLAQAKAAAAEWNKTAAKTAYDKALEIDPANTAAKDGLKLLAAIGEPGYEFRDRIGQNEQGPELVILAGGRTAVARRAVTRGDFRRFWNAAGKAEFAGKELSCRDRESFFRSARDRTWQSPGFEQEDTHPVVCVSWAEANAFAVWVGRQTGKRYRLLTPSEFDQLAARANDCSASNLADAAYNKKFDSRDGASCDDGYATTGPAARFAAGSNVRLWVSACGNGGAASASCRDHLAKGRSWMSSAKDPATGSDSFGNDVALNTVGFRLIREIDR